MEKTISETEGIKNWPEDDRPREKLLKNDAGGFENSRVLKNQPVIFWKDNY
ncbi:MAG: hypothetical protein Q8O30_10255 [Candidatus Omnitrophota bacterium]|nr:hypothetical protein [Candidatus Omnitrophota bacterium]